VFYLFAGFKSAQTELCRTSEGLTPLMLAGQLGMAEIAQLLLQYGASLSQASAD
jgi:hypothetical protein